MIAGVVTRDQEDIENFRASCPRAVLSHSRYDILVAFGGSGPGSIVATRTNYLVAAACTPPLSMGITDVTAGLLDHHRTQGSSANMQGCSFGIWDETSASLALYRDRAGVPPLFFWHTGETLRFATTIAALIGLGAPTEIDDIALGHYQLTGYIQAPRTMVRSIRKIPAGHRLELTSDELRVTRYWSPQWEPKLDLNSSEAANELEPILQRSIERVIPDSRRLGILLSSGIDSVGLAAIAAKRTDAAVNAFTFDYTDYKGRFNEGSQARQISDLLDIDHHVIEIAPQMVIEDYGRLTRDYEEPISYGIHSAWLGPVRDTGIEVAITGAVGGHWAYSRALDWANRIGRRMPDSTLTRAARLAAKLPAFAHDLATLLGLAAMSDPERYLADSQQVVLSAPAARLLRTEPEVIQRAQMDLVASLELVLTEMDGLSPTDRLAILGLSSFGAEHLLWWSHRWAEAAGISLRYPLLDREFVDFMGRQENRDKDSPERRIIAAKYLPHEIAYKKKTPQTIPIDHWLRGPLLDWAREILTKDEIEADGRLEFDHIQRCITAHASGDVSHKWCIWTSLSYLVWKREFLGAF